MKFSSQSILIFIATIEIAIAIGSDSGDQDSIDYSIYDYGGKNFEMGESSEEFIKRLLSQVQTTTSTTTTSTKSPEVKQPEPEIEIEAIPEPKALPRIDYRALTSDPDRADVVVTKNGAVRGKVVTVKKYRTVFAKAPVEKQVVAFLGIPFAKPPIGNLRFKRPVAPDNWNGLLDATKLPNTCPQIPADIFPGFPGEMQWNPNTNISEDCLYVNIWVPMSVFRNKAEKSSSVMVWIHGGGFHTGSSTLDIYNGAMLAGENDLIVASFQYRLGALGFLYFGIEDAPGNIGLVDQVFALTWINQNIGAFGGNPDEVTIFGESAGAASVSYQLLSPLSRSLFKRAIVMSGVATASWGFRPKSTAIEISYKIAKDAGCWTPKSRLGIGQVMDCMRQVKVDKLLTAQYVDPPKFIEQIPIYPTVDDYFLPDTPENLMNRWDTRRADLMMGTTADEGTYFLLYAYPKYFNRITKSNISYDIFMSTLRDIFSNRPPFEQDAIIAQYTNWIDPEDGHENHKRLGDAIGDAFFTCPCEDFAQKWAGRGSNVWYYYFEQPTESNPWGEWMGVMHGNEIEYAFGIPITNPNRPVHEMDVSIHFMILLTNFAKNGTASVSWEKYTPASLNFLNINGTTISDHSARNYFGPRAKECGFWNNYLPRLRRTMEKSGEISRANALGNCPPGPTVPIVSKGFTLGW